MARFFAWFSGDDTGSLTLLLQIDNAFEGLKIFLIQGFPDLILRIMIRSALVHQSSFWCSFAPV